jgi:hypothetical protein
MTGSGREHIPGQRYNVARQTNLCRRIRQTNQTSPNLYHAGYVARPWKTARLALGSYVYSHPLAAQVLGYPQERFGFQDEKASFVTDNVISNFHNQS